MLYQNDIEIKPSYHLLRVSCKPVLHTELYVQAGSLCTG